MKKRLFTLSFIALLMNATAAYAGWYNCYTFSGKIGPYNISLSFQIIPGYFGEKDKKEFNISGVYKYDNRNTPIKIEGRQAENNGHIILYETVAGKRSASLDFIFKEQKCTGTWTNLQSEKTLPVQLELITTLTDTSSAANFKNISILQAASLQNFYFEGIYNKKAGEDRASMSALKIIRKKDNVVFQTLDLAIIKTATGNIATVIFDNVEIGNNDPNNFVVWTDVGRMGGLLTVKYDALKKKFVLHPKPEVDGPQ
jgi:hypothetical protein